MEEIVKHFGLGFLQLIAAVAIMAIYMSFLQPGGVLSTTVGNFMLSICG